MRQNLKLLFFLKIGRKACEKFLSIYIRVTVNGQRAEWSVQRKCEVERWNKQAGRTTGKREIDKELNQYLDAIQANIYQEQKQYLLRNEPLSAIGIRNKILHTEDVQQFYLVEIYQKHNEQFENLVGKEYSYGTFKKFKSAIKSLKEFLHWKFGRKDVELSLVNRQFITDYEFYLKSVQLLQHNSAMGIIKKLKKIIRMCVANDWLDKDPFISYKITTTETHRNFLLQNELETLLNKRLVVERLELVRDFFLFSCYTGLSYSDVIVLTPKDIYTGVDGEQWIFTKRTKTNTASRIPILPVAIELINKYSSHPQALRTGCLFPKLSNQKLNSYLKEIADVCGFNKDLTFHCARHTFATTVTLTNGVPIETVGKMLGHKNLKTTQIYAKILDSKVSEDMLNLKQRLNTTSKINKLKKVL